MFIPKTRFCVNRRIAPNLDIAAFFRLVHRCGLSRVELRNDLPDGVTGHLSSSDLQALAQRYQIEIVTINALSHFNLPAPQLLKQARELLTLARAIHCPAIVLCPHNSPDDPRSAAQKSTDTLAALNTLAPLLQEYGIRGLVEPLGFNCSSLRSSLLAQALIRDSGAPYQLLLDTFHHHLATDVSADFSQQIAVENIGLVHLSGVEDTRPTDQLQDEQRIMLSSRDVLQSKAQVQHLEHLGYTGLYSFEPFSSTLGTWSEAEIEEAILSSMAYLNQ